MFICYTLTNATVVDDAIRFVSGMYKEKVKSASGKDDQEESNEPDYDGDQLEEEQEEEAGEMTSSTTTNQIF
jgi:hypothetical protein